MIRHRLPLLCAVAVLALLSTSGATFAQVLPLDHFKVYEVSPVPAPFPVQLTGQFDAAGVPAQLREIDHFANPTKKVHGTVSIGIADENRHLDWYVLDQLLPEPVRTIRYRNQFGLQSIDIHLPRYLLVPAQKLSHPGSTFPEEADHYKCYEVINVNVVPAIPILGLSDQFGPQTNVQVGRPVYFCVPVRKERPNMEPVGVFNAIDHLTVYDITPRAINREVKARDQFGTWDLKTLRSVWLAVPTEKLAVVPH